MNRRYFPPAAPTRMSAQRAAAVTPPAVAAARRDAWLRAAVEFVNLSAAAESVGEDHRARCSAWASAAVTRCCTRRSRGIVGYALGSPADLIEDSKAIQPGEAASFTLLQERLHSVLGTSSEREAGMVTMPFGLTDGQPKTLGEIGKVYGVTRKRIRQIESTTMSKLRHPSRSKVLRDYLD